MASTLNQICYDTWESVRSIITDDDELDIRRLGFWIKNQRANLLRRDYNKNYRVIDDRAIQVIEALPLQTVNVLSIPNVTLPVSKKVLRSSVRIPNTIEQYTKPTFTRIGSLDVTDRKFNYVDYTKLPYVGNGRLNKKEFYVTLIERYLYVISNDNNYKWKGLEYLNIQGVFEDVEELENLKYSLGLRTTEYSWDEYYPIGDWIIPFLKEEIKKTDLRQFIIPKDNTNDANAQPIEGQ